MKLPTLSRWWAPCALAVAVAVGLSSRPAPAATVALPSATATGQAPEVKIVTPQQDRPLSDPVVIQALVRSPDGTQISDVRAWLGDRELGRRQDPPYRWSVSRPAEATTIRVEATDGLGRRGTVEMVVSPGAGASFDADVRAVTLNLSVVDENDRFVSDLGRDEVIVRDAGVEQNLLEFTRARAPLRVALLLDRSGSMAARMDRTLDALEAFLRLLDRADRVRLFGFNDRVTSYTPWTSEHEVVAGFARLIRAEGGTALHDALRYGAVQLSAFGDAVERRAVLLLTDGRDSTSRAGLEEALDRLRDTGVTVFALGQGEALDDEELRDTLLRVAEGTGGQARFVEDPDELSVSLRRVAMAMRALYFVSWVPTGSEPGWHDIEVEIRRPGLVPRHRPGYRRTPESR